MKIQEKLLILVIVVFLSFAPWCISAEERDGDTVSEAAVENDLVLYVQQGCPHCEKVEVFIEEHDLEEYFVIKNLSLEPKASEEYTELLDTLEVPLAERGVPLLLYDDDQWITGDTPIISILRERFNIQEENDESVSEPVDYVILAGGMIFVGSIVGYGIVKMFNDRAEKD